ncbi:uncharacterized protein Z520_09609 [Fonsecaea multimorphosa CBS 102226]|uniref:Ketoreductase (KR) domain-containing protein n=1 Tax=Fonsecaea multimorphosa CBS 102226 TaxID=1442371 RepID=A0A0D2KCW4_9EURO|nr:uncharacterized protein Z520_09609 [Fonsecaea multimorphosa CBS 102226]KIX94563.1 hypothetical protein Z520_09609 [Fonsecaea multimorphosa CBS 102226]OAL20273.1 hypothetical protein AYO22_08985 [Fonsecaea multimorphosa]
MAVFGLKRMFDQKLNPPKPVTESFASRTILLTGATSGLGLEAAKKLAALHVEKLIITARSEAKGQAAKREIEDFVKGQGHSGDATAKPTEIIPMVLNMGSFAEIQSFVETLKSKFQAIDGAILNAGMMNSKYLQSSDGWEETLQVNTLSTFLLGILILPLLTAAADSGKNKNYKPHLTFVSSGTAWTVQPEQMKTYMASETPLEDLSAQNNFPPGIAGGATQYGRSKLVLEYAVRHLAASPAVKGVDGNPKVIINTVCPGLCKSDLGRNLRTNFFIVFVQWVLYSIFARTAEQGANAYIEALVRGQDTHGEMWKNDRVFEPGPMLATEEGRAFGEKAWSEVRQVIVKADSSTNAFLG